MVTLIGVFVNPTLIVEKKRKSDIEKEVELLGLKVVDVLCNNRFRLGWDGFSFLNPCQATHKACKSVG